MDPWVGKIPGSGRFPGGGNGNPLQCSGLENPMDGGAWRAAAHGVPKCRTRLSGEHTRRKAPPLKGKDASSRAGDHHPALQPSHSNNCFVSCCLIFLKKLFLNRNEKNKSEKEPRSWCSRATKPLSPQHTGERAEVRKEKGAQTWDTGTRWSRGPAEPLSTSAPTPSLP